MTEFVGMARDLTNAHAELLRSRGDTRINVAVAKLRNKIAAKQRKLAATPDRLRAKLDDKQAKLEGEIAQVTRRK